jgi:hypothetical protein
MDFIWQNKGALTAAAVLASFLDDPQPYINGVKRLVIDPVVSPIVKSVNWTLIVAVALAILFLPLIVRRITKARSGRRRKA